MHTEKNRKKKKRRFRLTGGIFKFFLLLHLLKLAHSIVGYLACPLLVHHTVSATEMTMGANHRTMKIFHALFQLRPFKAVITVLSYLFIYLEET